MAQSNPWDEFSRAPEDGAISHGGATLANRTAPTPSEFDEFAPVEDVGADQSTSLSAYAQPTLGKAELSEDGSSTFARPEDQAYAQKVQDLLGNGAQRADFDALADASGYPRYGPELDQAIAAAAQGQYWTVGVPEFGRQEASVMAPISNNAVGAAVIGADLGLSDEIAGLAGGDRVMDVLGGTGEAQQRAQMAKDAIGEEHPFATIGGQIASGITGTAALGKLAGPGRQIAADALFGAEYGAAQNNDNRLGGAALGGGASAAGSYFGGKLLDKIANRAPSRAAQTVAAGKQFGIDVPMGATGRGAAIIEKGLDNLPGSAGVMQAGRDLLTEEVGNAVEDVASSFGPTTSYAGVGEVAQSGAKRWIDKFQRTAAKAYDAIPISPNSPTTLDTTAGTLKALTGKFSSNEKLASALKNTRLSQYMDALGQADSKLSWEDLKAFRSRIGEEIGDQLFSDGTMKSELRGLYAALSEDMKATAAAQGPGALRAFERANNIYRQGQQRIDGALTKLLGNDSNKAAEAAAAKIQAIARDGKGSADLATLAEIRKSIPEEWPQVQNGLIRLLGQPANSAGREFDPGVFVRTYRDMAPEARNLFFGGGGGELRKNLEDFVGVLDSLGKVNAMRNTSNTAIGLTGAGTVGTIAASLLNPILGAKLGATVAGNYALGKLWTNPRFVNWATGYARMSRAAAAANGTPNVSKQLDLLKKVAAAEPAIAQDALGLQQYLAQTFAATPSKLAADEGQEPSQ